jgi:hypothetical protein
MPARKHDHFMVDALKPKARLRHMGYLDGFRFGFGFFVSGVLVALILGLLSAAIVAVFHLH